MRKILYYIPIAGLVFCIKDVQKQEIPEPHYTMTAIYHAATFVGLVVLLFNYYKYKWYVK